MRLLLTGFILHLPISTWGAVLEIHDAAELTAALAKPRAGDIWKLHPGEFRGGHFLNNVKDLTIEAADPQHPPTFSGGTTAWHLTRCHGLTLRHLSVSGQSDNGINLDDGGPDQGAVHGVTLENLTIRDIGPTGNFDGIKCSGLADLTIRACTIHGWGGQAIDLVGCHRALITDCRILGKTGFSQHTGPQFKGGCEDIILEKCTIRNAGSRPIQLGGSTGLSYFRPVGATFEARRITVRANHIEGGECAAAFTGVDGAEFSQNTVIHPTKWFFRVLTENENPGFPPTQNVILSNNTFTFLRSQISTPINQGPNTLPAALTFTHNSWFAEDKPSDSNPRLATPEVGGRYGVK